MMTQEFEIIGNSLFYATMYFFLFGPSIFLKVGEGGKVWTCNPTHFWQLP